LGYRFEHAYKFNKQVVIFRIEVPRLFDWLELRHGNAAAKCSRLPLMCPDLGGVVRKNSALIHQSPPSNDEYEDVFKRAWSPFARTGSANTTATALWCKIEHP
jgi:hypothetical protein